MRKVVSAELHSGFFLPGTLNGGQFPAQLPPSNKTMKNFLMRLQEDGSLLLNWEEGAFRKHVHVGAANVKVAVLESETIQTASSTKSK